MSDTERNEIAARALVRLARAEEALAQTIGADIDGRGRTRLLEVARDYRRGRMTTDSAKEQTHE